MYLLDLPTVGKAMSSTFGKQRIEDCTTPRSDVISKAKLYTFLLPAKFKRSPSLSNKGKLRADNKYQIIGWLPGVPSLKN